MVEPATALDPAPSRGTGRRARIATGDLALAAVLTCWLAVFALFPPSFVPKVVGNAWRFFPEGAHLLLASGNGGGVHLYAAHPNLQIGPVAFVVSLPFTVLPTGISRDAGLAFMTLLGLPVIILLCRLIGPGTRHRLRKIAICGFLAAPTWAEVAVRAGHLDDVLALFFGVAALSSRLRGHRVATVLLVAAAADSKPWAVAFAVLALDADRSFRDNVKLLGLLAVAVALPWSPFLLGDLQTLRTAHFTIPNSPASGLRALGWNGPRTPTWDRPVQFALGTAAAAVAILRRRPGAVLLLGVCARLLLDPKVYAYYSAGLLVGAVAFDLTVTRWPIPVVTIAATLLVFLPTYLLDQQTVLGYSGDELSGDLRVAFCITAPLFALLARVGPSRRNTNTGGQTRAAA